MLECKVLSHIEKCKPNLSMNFSRDAVTLSLINTLVSSCQQQTMRGFKIVKYSNNVSGHLCLKYLALLARAHSIQLKNYLHQLDFSLISKN